MSSQTPPQTQPGRCLNCRSEIQVPETYADGDNLQCHSCGAGLRVLRRGALRLVIADVEPVRHELKAAQQRIASLEKDLARARASLGIGANGLGIGVLYVVAKVALEEQPLSRELLLTAVGIAILTGILLELANLLFLAKRREMSRLSAEIAEMQKDADALQRKIRESVKR
jgi:hypothetical protein